MFPMSLLLTLVGLAHSVDAIVVCRVGYWKDVYYSQVNA